MPRLVLKSHRDEENNNHNHKITRKIKFSSRKNPRTKEEKEEFEKTFDDMSRTIEKAMKRTHASYASLAEETFLDKRQTAHIRKILEHDVSPNLRTLIRIANALDCHFSIKMTPKKDKQ